MVVWNNKSETKIDTIFQGSSKAVKILMGCEFTLSKILAVEILVRISPREVFLVNGVQSIFSSEHLWRAVYLFSVSFVYNLPASLYFHQSYAEFHFLFAAGLLFLYILAAK